MGPKNMSVPVLWFMAIGFYFATFLAVALAMAWKLEEDESAASQNLHMANMISATSTIILALKESRGKRSCSSDTFDMIENMHEIV